MQQFGPYQLVRRIGSGGMGEIFLATLTRDSGFEKQLVIKRILPHLSTSTDFIAMFNNEAMIAAQLNHPNICQIFDFGCIDGDRYIAMEFVPGVDLRTLLQHCKGIPAEHAVTIAVACLKALDYAYNELGSDGKPLHIIHRDVSPQNIMVSPRGDMKLMDFGLARGLNRDSVVSGQGVKGNFGYMSPEQIVAGTIDCRSDLFNLAACLYEMLCGSALYPADLGLQALCKRIADAEFIPIDKRNGQLPGPLVAVLHKALSRDPGDRFESAAEFRSALEESAKQSDLQPNSLNLGQFVSLVVNSADLQVAAMSSDVVNGERFITAAAVVPARSLGPNGMSENTVVARDPAKLTVSEKLPIEQRVGPDVAGVPNSDDSIVRPVNDDAGPSTRRLSFKLLLLVMALCAALVLILVLLQTGERVTNVIGPQIAYVPPAVVKPRVQTGKLVLRWKPATARVEVAGRTVTSGPPYRADLKAGEHRVKITLQGYVEQVFQLHITAGGSHDIERQLLKRARRVFSVELDSIPSGASVNIDGLAITRKTPTRLNLSAGKHVLQLSKNGYHVYKTQLQINAKTAKKLTVTLRRQQLIVTIGRHRVRAEPGKRGVAKFRLGFYDVRVPYVVGGRVLTFGVVTTPYSMVRVGRIRKNTPVVGLRLGVDSRRTVYLQRADQLPKRFTVEFVVEKLK